MRRVRVRSELLHLARFIRLCRRTKLAWLCFSLIGHMVWLFVLRLTYLSLIALLRIVVPCAKLLLPKRARREDLRWVRETVGNDGIDSFVRLRFFLNQMQVWCTLQ